MFYLMLALLGIFPSVMAYNSFDLGDTLALILGLSVGIVGFFACMGAYSRRRNHFETL